MGVDSTGEKIQNTNIPDNFYATFVILEGELSLAEIQDAVSNNNGKLLVTFSNFQNILKKINYFYGF